MQREKVKAAVLEATRFIGKATELLKAMESDECREYGIGNPKESGATRRASMDLTRELSRMRKP